MSFKVNFKRSTKRLPKNIYRCVICNDAAHDFLSHLAPELFMCICCAEKVANVYRMATTGLWLTWKNDPLPHQKKETIPPSLRKQVFERDKYRCLHCGTHIDLCADHIHPESKGGKTEIENLQTLCRSCNSRKGVASPYEGVNHA